MMTPPAFDLSNLIEIRILNKFSVCIPIQIGICQFGPFALKVGLFAMIVKKYLMNIMQILIEIKK